MRFYTQRGFTSARALAQLGEPPYESRASTGEPQLHGKWGPWLPRSCALHDATGLSYRLRRYAWLLSRRTAAQSSLSNQKAPRAALVMSFAGERADTQGDDPDRR